MIDADNLIGLVNVGLLCNTFRVMSPVSRAAKVAAETVMTFGHDASGESPMAPHFNFRPQSAVPSHGSGHQTYNSSQTSSDHSRNSSWSSVDSSTGLTGAEKASCKSIKAKAAPPGLHIVPLAELRRQFDSEPGLVSPHGNTDVKVMAGSPLYAINLSPCPPRVVCLRGDASREPWMQDEKCSLESMADADTFGKVTKEPFIGSRASLVSNFAVVPLDVTSKSVTLVPRPETNLCSAEDANKSNARHISCSSYATMTTLSTDCSSRYSGEVMHAYRIRPHSQFPQPNDDEEGRDAVGSFPPDLQRRSAWWRRITRASVWSQASGYDMNEFSDEESQEAYWEVIAESLDPQVMSDDEVDRVMSRRATFARRQTLRIQALAESKRSNSSDTSNIKSHTAPNDTV